MLLRKITWLLIFLAGSLKITAQADQNLKTLFFGLELDSSISWVQQKLRKDIRFSEVTELRELPMMKYTGSYVAPRTENVPAFDSANLSLRVVIPALVNKLESTPHSKKEYCMQLIVTHYFHSFDQAYKAYESVAELLKGLSMEHRAHSDQNDASMYSDFKLDGEKGIRTQLVAEANGNFKLLLIYSCRASR